MSRIHNPMWWHINHMTLFLGVVPLWETNPPPPPHPWFRHIYCPPWSWSVSHQYILRVVSSWEFNQKRQNLKKPLLLPELQQIVVRELAPMWHHEPLGQEEPNEQGIPVEIVEHTVPPSVMGPSWISMQVISQSLSVRKLFSFPKIPL